MHDQWRTAEELIESGHLSKTNLVAHVRNSALVAHDYQSFAPVDWQQLEQQFSEIQAMAKQQIPGAQWGNVPGTNQFTGQRTVHRQRVPAQVAPLKIQYDEWTDANGNAQRTPRLSWTVLHDLLSRQAKPTIPASQYEEILAGWGNRQIEEIVLQSVFSETDILAITGQEQGDRAPTGAKESPQKTKAHKNLLKMIGALVQIRYLETAKPNTKFMKNDGSANAKTISEDIHEGLRRAGIENFAGLEERTLQDRIREGLTALAENRD